MSHELDFRAKDTEGEIAMDIIELQGCADCVMLLANGEYPPDNTEEQDRALDAAIGQRWKGYNVVVAGDQTSEESFSCSACDVCGSHLGGSRYPCTAWRFGR